MLLKKGVKRASDTIVIHLTKRENVIIPEKILHFNFFFSIIFNKILMPSILIK